RASGCANAAQQKKEAKRAELFHQARKAKQKDQMLPSDNMRGGVYPIHIQARERGKRGILATGQ
ncbi:MAG: hypothetical protein ABIQ35_09305, partial [Verrucomicrobiota bacterium]